MSMAVGYCLKAICAAIDYALRTIWPGRTYPNVQVSGTAHQFLSKPTQQLELEEMVARVETAQSHSTGSRFATGSDSTGCNPCQTHILALLNAELTRPDPLLDKIARLVSRDVGMSAKSGSTGVVVVLWLAA